MTVGKHDILPQTPKTPSQPAKTGHLNAHTLRNSGYTLSLAESDSVVRAKGDQEEYAVLHRFQVVAAKIVAIVDWPSLGIPNLLLSAMATLALELNQIRLVSCQTGSFHSLKNWPMNSK